MYGYLDSTYIAYPEDKTASKAILLLADIFGHKFPNNQIIADQLAPMVIFGG